MRTSLLMHLGFINIITGGMVGGHAIKLVGWGHDEATGELYWVCQNQWSEKMGHGRIRECGGRRDRP
jgi:hypothetical protein